MDLFVKIIDRTNERIGKFAAYFTIPVFLIVVYGVIMRYGFNSPLTWGLELTTFLCALTYCMGGAYVHLSKKHVRMDVLYMRWSPKGQARMDLIMSPIFFIVMAALIWAGGDWAITALIKGKTSGSVWDPTIWPVRMFIPLGAFLMFFQGIANFIRDLRIVLQGGQG